MKYIDVDDDVYRELERLAAAWHTTVAGALARFVTTALDPAGGVPGGEPRRRPVPSAAHGSDASDRAEATSEAGEDAVTGSPAPGTPALAWWVCRGCGTTYLDSDADMIADHVKDCELVDGAGNPLPGGGGA